MPTYVNENATDQATAHDPVVGTGLNAQRLSQITNFVNVKTFGAKGDGSTDDTQAFINAIAATLEGGVLFVPNGQYKITSTLVISRSIKVKGTEQTGANATTTNGSVILFTGTGTVFSLSKQNTMLEHLYLLNQGAASNNGVTVANDGSTNMSNIELSHITCMNFNIGFSLAYAYFVNLNYCRAAGCVIGFNVVNCATTVNFEKCWALQCSDKGYYINGLGYSNLFNCGADSNKTSYYFDGCNGVSLYNCGTEVSTDIAIYANNSTLSFIGCVSYKNNSSQTNFVSFAKFENSFIGMINCYEYTLFFGASQANNVSVLLNNTILHLNGSYLRNFPQLVAGDITSKIFGEYHKDGGVANDRVGDLSTVNGATLGIAASDVVGFLNGLITQDTTKYASNISSVSGNRPVYLTSAAPGNPSPGEHTLIIPFYMNPEYFYLAITATNKLFIGYSSNGGTTISWLQK